MRPLLLISPIFTLLLCSCALYAPDERAELNNIPERFSLYSEDAPDMQNRWWESFGSAELNTLIDEALTNSPTIQQAWARLAQAEAIAAKAGAARIPSLGYETSTSGRRNMQTKSTLKNYDLGFSASYELDLWGRVQSQTEAAALDRAASREQLNSAAVSLAAQTALRWTGIISQKLQTELIRSQLESNKTSLELIELRFRRSFASALDVYQQRQTVAATESRIPLAELREQLLRNELTALLGRADFQNPEITGDQLPIPGSLPTIGIPAEVLANRPDVRRAGLQLRAADWAVSASRADRLPAIRLTAGAEYQNNRFSDLLDDWFANLAGSVTGPIFEGGRRKAEVERTRAVVDERLAAYREVVINAIKEVEDALVSEQKQRDYITALDRNLELSRSSYDEAVNRYRNGLIEYLPVLVELIGLQNLERDRVEAQYNLLQYRINLYRALGGSWPNELSAN
ncbi:MAG: TolC family protein [Kiritimatiellales bacterium]|nr:TolC family protein [Kiritimatiellales bacterium]